MKEYFGDSTGRYYPDAFDRLGVDAIRRILCDRCLAIYESHYEHFFDEQPDNREFCERCEKKLADAMDVVG